MTDGSPETAVLRMDEPLLRVPGRCRDDMRR